MARAMQNPLALLQRMQLESRRSSPGLPEQVQAAPLWTGLGFRLGDQRFVTPLDQVTEVLPCPPVTLVPGTKAWLRGVTNVRGSLYTVIDLPQYFGKPAEAADERNRLLIMNVPGLSATLLVDEVYGLRHFDEEQERRQIGGLSGQALAHVRGAFLRDQVLWCVFDMHSLAASPEFRRVAA
jgi:twitching motility protein PilI